MACTCTVQFYIGMTTLFYHTSAEDRAAASHLDEIIFISSKWLAAALSSVMITGSNKIIHDFANGGLN